MLFFCFKQKTAYEMRISDWSSDVCSSDLPTQNQARTAHDVPHRCKHGNAAFYAHHYKSRTAIQSRKSALMRVVDEAPVMPCAELGLVSLRALLEPLGLRIAEVADDLPLPGSYWGDREAGLIADTQIGRAHVCTPVTNARHVCRILL